MIKTYYFFNIQRNCPSLIKKPKRKIFDQLLERFSENINRFNTVSFRVCKLVEARLKFLHNSVRFVQCAGRNNQPRIYIKNRFRDPFFDSFFLFWRFFFSLFFFTEKKKKKKKNSPQKKKKRLKKKPPKKGRRNRFLM